MDELTVYLEKYDIPLDQVKLILQGIMQIKNGVSEGKGRLVIYLDQEIRSVQVISEITFKKLDS